MLSILTARTTSWPVTFDEVQKLFFANLTIIVSIQSFQEAFHVFLWKRSNTAFEELVELSHTDWPRFVSIQELEQWTSHFFISGKEYWRYSIWYLLNVLEEIGKKSISVFFKWDLPIPILIISSEETLNKKVIIFRKY